MLLHPPVTSAREYVRREEIRTESNLLATIVEKVTQHDHDWTVPHSHANRQHSDRVGTARTRSGNSIEIQPV